MTKFVFFGDSVTEAHRDINNPDDLGQGFVFNLSKDFPDIQFYNKGISGQRVKDLLTRVEDDVITLQPDICFIWIGVNDAWLPHLLNQQKSISTFMTDYNVLIDILKKKLINTKIVLIKPFSVLIGHVSIEIYQDVERFRKQTETLALKHSIDFIDIKEIVEQKLRFMPANQLFHDGIHPTFQGYEVITFAIEQYIKEINYK